MIAGRHLKRADGQQLAIGLSFRNRRANGYVTQRRVPGLLEIGCFTIHEGTDTAQRQEAYPQWVGLFRGGYPRRVAARD